MHKTKIHAYHFKNTSNLIKVFIILTKNITKLICFKKFEFVLSLKLVMQISYADMKEPIMAQFAEGFIKKDINYL